jgi:5-(carboxyamino)imidazole ribonucleotide synthase
MKSNSNTEALILPGSTIGIFGSGQLGKMTAIAAKHMGYRVHVFSPSHDSPAGQVADLEFQASYTDLAAVEAFAKQVDVITLEFENVPIEALETAQRFTRVSPGPQTLSITQNRSLEKQFLTDQGIPTCKYHIVRTLDQLKEACNELMPAILKTTTDGYDGKGQAVIRDVSDIEPAWESLQTEEAILEEMIEFDFEFSVIAARNAAGEFAAYPAIRNEHHNQILDVSLSPSGLHALANNLATKVVNQVMGELETIGVLCVEFFFSKGEILVNEIAPRPHNSGHLTIEAHETSQFEQQVRAVCGLPLGATDQPNPAAMANLLGDLWENGDPKWELALGMPNVKLHLYGKDAAKAGRKMGHLTATAGTIDDAWETVVAARKLLQPVCAKNPQ